MVGNYHQGKGWKIAEIRCSQIRGSTSVIKLFKKIIKFIANYSTSALMIKCGLPAAVPLSIAGTQMVIQLALLDC